MRVEHYSQRFKEDVIFLIEEFHRQFVSSYDGEIYRPTVEQTIADLEAKGVDKSFLMIIDEKCVGLLAGIEMKSFLNDKRMYSEIFFFVDRSFGSYAFWFMNQCERMLKAQGYSIMVMAILNSPKAERMTRMYELAGYKHLESHYIKSL